MVDFTEIMSKYGEPKLVVRNIGIAKVNIKTCLDVDTFASIVQTVAKSTFTNSSENTDNSSSKTNTENKDANSSETNAESKDKNSSETNADNHDEYRAENREIARRYCIIKYMTDIKLGNTNVTEVFKATQCGNWYSQIEAEVTKLPIWAEVETAIDNQIAYLIGTRQTAFDKLCTDVSAIIKTDNTQNLADVKEVLEKLDKVDKQEFVEAVVEQSVKKTKKK